MRKLFTTFVMLFACSVAGISQTVSPFVGTIYNKEYDIYLKINFSDCSITVPGQEFMGEMCGFLGDNKDFRKWFILDTERKTDTEYSLIITNDEGSEDLSATLLLTPDGTYTLRQGSGSTLKIARNRKWQKLPKELVFTNKKETSK